MCFGRVPEPEVVRCFESSLILYAEDSFNASTFTARVVTSTLSDLYSAVTAAIGALKGPLHGGANEAALRRKGIHANEPGLPGGTGLPPDGLRHPRLHADLREEPGGGRSVTVVSADVDTSRRRTVIVWPAARAGLRPHLVALGRRGTELSRLGPEDVLDSRTRALLRDGLRENGQAVAHPSRYSSRAMIDRWTSVAPS
ncbi:citrate synthase [Streptomyces paromomycinus]|uniref:Citrate synthase n=1 Tax=Streptomyces paromomycinus TaxID=92743 RepID=A0A401VYX9_STREY|nr:citrate synthase [Streptomyces paromomycinus]